MKIEVLDTTLRDGEQGEGISFSVLDKLHILSALTQFGIPLVEVGAPSISPKNKEFFNAIPPSQAANLVAFSSTRRKDKSVIEDELFCSLLQANTTTCCIYGKASTFHVTHVLETSLEENLSMIHESIAYLKKHNKRVIFDAEHFFDGYILNPSYALSCLQEAKQAGADVLCLCDTNGGSFPDDIHRITKIVVDQFSPTVIGIHCHNDSGFAEANTYTAVLAGARHIQGTLLGLGERCGNCNLSTIIPTLQLKKGYELVPISLLPNLTKTAIMVADISNISLNSHAPYVGKSAFSHKAGAHADAVLKSTNACEHIDPKAVGNSRRFLLSEVAGRGVVVEKIRHYYPQFSKDSAEVKRILERLKKLESEGYQFESAEASFILAAMRALGEFTSSFELVSYKAINEQPAVEGIPASALVKIRVDGKTQMTASEGNGPVNALDKALREALTTFYPSIAEIALTDYKVRVLTPESATAAMVRVLITSTDGKNIWTTVGVSSDVIDASFKALVDSIEYKLVVLKTNN